jgi:hypothetical protein
MQGNFIPCRHAAGFFRHSIAARSGGRVPLRESHSLRSAPPKVEEAVGPDAYKVAVVLLIAAAVLSGCV